MGLNEDIEKIGTTLDSLIRDYKDYTYQDYTRKISNLLATMTKVVNQLVSYKKFQPKNTEGKNTLELLGKTLSEANFYSDVVYKLETYVNNFSSSLLDSNNEWMIYDSYENLTEDLMFFSFRLKELSNNVYLFCELVNELFVKSKYDEEKLSTIIFDLLDLGYDKQADLIQDALDSLENGSDYEFCGKIRSSLEQIVEQVVIEKGKEKADRLHKNLQILKREGIINEKLREAIHSNYSYGSKIIHNEVSLSSAEAKLFVDQAIYHIQFLIKKVQELRSDNN